MKRRSHGQMSLALEMPDAEAWLSCRGVFSTNYLRKHFVQSENYPMLEDVRGAYRKVNALWDEEHVGLARRREAYTRTLFLEPVLKELGWHFIPEQDLPAKYGPKCGCLRNLS